MSLSSEHYICNKTENTAQLRPSHFLVSDIKRDISRHKTSFIVTELKLGFL